MAKNSAIGPRTSTGKKVTAPTIKIVANQNTPNTTVSVRSVLVVTGVFWFATILIVGALTFFPVLVLGPIAEFFAMKNGLTF